MSVGAQPNQKNTKITTLPVETINLYNLRVILTYQVIISIKGNHFDADLCSACIQKFNSFLDVTVLHVISNSDFLGH